MKKEDTKIVEGEVLEALPNTMFKVKLDDHSNVVATLKGKLRRSYVRIFPGDRVKIEMTKYDRERGRIVFKFKSKKRR
ncbi:translation initiation factor IF-1 [Candidatus Woesebacteria bacterium]|nr:translation initiation factor IF-1 [Candidatus Woesebacteria bacterium]